MWCPGVSHKLYHSPFVGLEAMRVGIGSTHMTAHMAHTRGACLTCSCHPLPLILEVTKHTGPIHLLTANMCPVVVSECRTFDRHYFESVMVPHAHSLAVMSEQADWGAVPHAVVSTILWSNDLHFVDKLRCQEVCQAWKSLLRKRPGALAHSNLPTEFCIRFCRTNNSQHRAVRLDADPPAIHVNSQVEPAAHSTFEDTVSACCRWLKLQARLFRKIQLCGYIAIYSHTWSGVRRMISALQVAPPQAPPAIAITMPLGKTTLTKGHILNPP